MEWIGAELLKDQMTFCVWLARIGRDGAEKNSSIEGEKPYDMVPHTGAPGSHTSPWTRTRYFRERKVQTRTGYGIMTGQKNFFTPSTWRNMPPSLNGMYEKVQRYGTSMSLMTSTKSD